MPAASAAVIATSASTAPTAGLLRLEAVAAENRTIASGLKRNRGLLAAAGANHSGSCGRALAVSAAAAITTTVTASTATLVGFLGLPAGLAALGRGITSFLEERLVGSSECEFPPAVATGKLQISSHCLPRFDV
jgi:hypothetical protein